MTDVLKMVMEEDAQEFEYPDEKVASNLYYISFSNSLRGIAGRRDEEKKDKEESNEWLRNKTQKIVDVPVLNFDHIVSKLKNGTHMCDALFYNAELTSADSDTVASDIVNQHFLAEFKGADKKKVLELLEDNGSDGIYRKVSDSVQMILKELEFGGSSEHEELIAHTHFFLVYAGKNNMPERNPVVMPGKRTVLRDSRGKQRTAGRMDFDSEKKDNDVYTRFGNKIQALGLERCEEKVFPGKALPAAEKLAKGSKKARWFSVFSAQDFAEIVDYGFFDNWKWGSYSQYFQCIS